MMSIGNIISSPKITDDFRRVLKAEYNASLKTMQGFWVVVEANTGLYVGRLESINPDHGDITLNSVERIDVKLTADKVWIRGSQVRQLLMVDKNSKDRAVAVAFKVFKQREEEVL